MSHFEAQLIHHAAPTLRGIKQANLFSLPLEQLPRFRAEIARYQKQLAPYGIRLLYLYCCKKRTEARERLPRGRRENPME